MKKRELLQLFAAPTGTTVSGDLEKAISIDFTTRIARNIKELQTVLGVSELTPMPAGTDIKVYKIQSKGAKPAQVAEGEVIALSEFERKLVATHTLKLDKYRKNTTAEAIQKVGRDIAVNKTDEKLVLEVQKDTKKSFYDMLKTGTGTTKGVGLQKALANAWAKLQGYYEDMDVNPIFFVNPQDVADYLGSAQVTMQTAFGFTYIESFLGLGTVIVSPQVEAKKPVATAKENLNGAYVPVSGDVGQTFNLTSDSTGLIGMTHAIKTDNASIDTLVLSCVKFYPEFADGVFKATIEAPVGP
jgi:hypothetical protein|nr:MAG TPA: major capsid protein [Caudoviricetes sp.]